MAQAKTEKVIPKEKSIPKEEELETLVRILGFDIPGSKSLYPGLTRIKGVSWAVSNLTCTKLGFLKSKKVSELSKSDIAKIEQFLKSFPAPDFLKNRRFDLESGENAHYFGVDLDLKKEFDIKRLRKIKSYRGLRHAAKLPSRGQRTRSNFRSKGKAVGVKRKKLGKKS